MAIVTYIYYAYILSALKELSLNYGSYLHSFDIVLEITCCKFWRTSLQEYLFILGMLGCQPKNL